MEKEAKKVIVESKDHQAHRVLLEKKVLLVRKVTKVNQLRDRSHYLAYREIEVIKVKKVFQDQREMLVFQEIQVNQVLEEIKVQQVHKV